MLDQTVIEAINGSPLNRGLDGATWLATPGNIAIDVAGNIALFDWHGDDTFEIHVLFLNRGALAVLAAREAFRRMFLDHAAELIFGMVPDFRRDVKLLARWAGMKFAGLRSTTEGPCELYVLPRENWKDEPK